MGVLPKEGSHVSGKIIWMNLVAPFSTNAFYYKAPAYPCMIWLSEQQLTKTSAF